MKYGLVYVLCVGACLDEAAGLVTRHRHSVLNSRTGDSMPFPDRFRLVALFPMFCQNCPPARSLLEDQLVGLDVGLNCRWSDD